MELVGFMFLLYILFTLFMLGALAGILAFWIWMIVDCAKHELPGNEKIVWLLVIVLLNWVGALVYFIVRRSPRKKGLAAPAIIPPPPPPLKPEPVRVAVQEIRFNCGTCNQSLSIDPSGAGITVDCPTCGKPVYVPSR